MLTITRKEGEKIILFANDQTMIEQIGKSPIEITVKAINVREKDRIENEVPNVGIRLDNLDARERRIPITKSAKFPRKIAELNRLGAGAVIQGI